MEKIISLAKQRGFIYPGSEIYGGLANSWDYGPLGVELKNNIKALWWDLFVRRRDDMVGLDAALIMNPKVWEASGHVSEFNDPMVECKKCHSRFRADKLPPPQTRRGSGGGSCPECAGELTAPAQFNMMFRTHLGPVEDESNVVYLRPETAQAIFVDFKNVLQTSRKTLPFGIAQIGKAFRNEITPGNFIFRTREFEQMEIEYFIPAPKDDKDWEEPFAMWVKEMHEWIKACGINSGKVHEFDVPKDELAHYSKKTVDFQFDFPFGKDELYGLAYRTDFDLKNHFKEAPYKDPASGEDFWPHVIEPSLGVDRTLLAILASSYSQEGDREVLKLAPKLAPYKVAVFPLMRNKPELVAKAQSIYQDLRQKFMAVWDDRGNVGKRYYSQDQIGTPYCITIDFTTLEDDTATIRDRDTMQQVRVKVGELAGYVREKLN
ncbi:MAG: glycine--tRNA ligase [Parcubacteria group bacterium]|nr:glycine--tRNA ligase [Parcubacteria group bacterium]